MIKLTAILFLFIYLFSATDFSEVLKLPVLWQHYQEHQASNPHISFIGFLKQHYLNDNSKAPDYQNDMQLPFKTPVQFHLSAVATLLPVIASESKQPIYSDSNTAIPLDDNRVCSDFLSVIWQPPKA